MAIEIPRGLVEEILLGPLDDRRQLQDSPILGDVWIAFARRPDQALDLLITPYKESVASAVAVMLNARVRRPAKDDPTIAFLEGIVAARLYFEEVLRIVVPLTQWWHSARVRGEVQLYLREDTGPEKLNRAIDAILAAARRWGDGAPVRTRELSAVDRYVALAGLLLWAGSAPAPEGPPVPFAEAVRAVSAQTVADRLIALLDAILEGPPPEQVVFQVSCNRTASAAVARSIPAVKADAARQLFSISCRDLTWAVIDSGIDGSHPAFEDKKGQPRVRKTFDFTQFRRIVSLGNAHADVRKENLAALRTGRKRLPSDADRILRELAEGASNGPQIDWRRVETLVELDTLEAPLSEHGTHVAGILGASAEAQRRAGVPDDDCLDGMCPDINLYDFRVLAPTLLDTEFAVIAALQYIRYLNERHRFVTVHGVNLSLSIPHDVRNYACGQTPVCLECERLVESGVVVVAAAGNRGYQSFETKHGAYEGYAAFSLTDPGNADGVITVGSTHRYSPHTYGVSFFSSRGPTGDGRPKPDLVAPGERIRAPLPGGHAGDLDGTSMAAPHVSGAAAMLMARYTELIGKPRRIKDILCETATDLGRERSFQGHGMIDVLRALQSV